MDFVNKKIWLAVLISLFLVSNVMAFTESIGMDDYVIDFEYDENDVEAGETFRLSATVTNEAGETRENIRLSLDLSDPFDEIGDDERTIGTLEDEESKTVSFRIEIEPDAPEEEYDIEFEIKDDVSEDSDEFIVKVESNNPELIIGDINSLPTTISPDTEDVRLTLDIENVGDGDAEFVKLKLVLPEGFIASGSFTDIANLGTINEGWSKDVDFYIDTAERISSGRHVGILEVEYENEDNDHFSDSLEFDLPVKGRPQFSITSSETNPKSLQGGDEGELRLTVRNLGAEEGEETSVRVFENSDQPFDFVEKTNFIGSLEPGEAGTGTLDFEVDSDATDKTYLVRVQVRTVSGGNVLVEEMTVPVKVVPREGSNIIYYVIAIAVILVIVLVVLLSRAGKEKRKG